MGATTMSEAGTGAGRMVGPTLVAAGALVACATVTLHDPNVDGSYGRCPFLALTGRPCPGCGTLRALHALLHGRVLEAVSRNALSLAVLPLLAYAWLTWARSSWVGAPRTWHPPPWLGYALATAVPLFWLARNTTALSVLAP
ncbi:MAG: DUF2752 domain-containing protein [Actinomyces sp.]|nr:MAG: DUF2752 domain-containing protein [Actinomyces sp.]